MRTWLRQELTLVTKAETEVFKKWESDVLLQASFYDGPVVVQAGDDAGVEEVRIFKDRFEEWEQQAIDGTGSGARIRLSVVKKDNAARFRLQEKYKGLFFVDKDPDGDNGYYEDRGGPVDSSAWEHRKILGLIWESHRGWRVETKVCGDETGPSTNYLINSTLIRMIKESDSNTSIKYASDM